MSEKKAYSQPVLTVHGSVQDLTLTDMNKTPGVGDTITIADQTQGVPGSRLISHN